MDNALTTLAPIDLFLHAGLVGKTVILVLVAASAWCWVLIIEGIWGVVRLKRAVSAARAGRTKRLALLAHVIAAGRDAAALTIPGETAGEARVRVTEAMGREAQVLLGRIERGLPSLAVISSAAPFVGLFGTVWGIMVSFAAIAEARDTGLAVVAPGIAEALAATAIGLAAAIPASVGYNGIAAALSRSGQGLQHVIEEYAIALTAPGGQLDSPPVEAI
jgi:biopolymer transport protein ExbB/TolQ